MKDLEELKDKIAPLKGGKWVAAAVPPATSAAIRSPEEVRVAVEERGNTAVDEAIAACFLAMSGATPAEPTATEALKYIDAVVDSMLVSPLVPAASAILRDVKVSIRASLERLAKGGSLHATTPVGDFER